MLGIEAILKVGCCFTVFEEFHEALIALSQMKMPSTIKSMDLQTRNGF